MDEARFWAKVDTSGGPDACWPWLGSRDRHDYGYAPEGRAHRVAYELVVGPIPAGLTIDHLCRNHPCVNPAHLEPVTNKENVQRGVEARLGRRPIPAPGPRNPRAAVRGSRNPAAKITEADVVAIRAAAASGESHYRIAARYPIGKTTVWKIIAREKWQHVRMSWTKQDAVLDAIHEALGKWSREERRARDLRGITKADVRRVDRMPDGSRIPTPRRNALARFLTDAALTAIREYEAPPSEAPSGGLDPEPDLRAALSWALGVIKGTVGPALTEAGRRDYAAAERLLSPTPGQGDSE